jgi:flagellar basal body-associated protein FliL
MLKILGLGLGLISAVVTGFIFYQSMNSLNRFSKHSAHMTATSESGGHEAVKESAHGGGHEAAKTEGHGGGGHEAAKTEGHGGGGHGESSEGEKRETASSKGMIPFLSLDEMFANINQEKSSHTLAIKVDVEFFDVEAKQAFKANQPAVKNLIIQTSREQEYEQLSTLSGKLYYKELLIRRINEHFHKPLVKDVHFASFFLQ